MDRRENNCCCCEVAADLTLAAWESWSSCMPEQTSAEQAAEHIAAMYARIHPVVSKNCTCGCRPSSGQ